MLPEWLAMLLEWLAMLPEVSATLVGLEHLRSREQFAPRDWRC